MKALPKRSKEVTEYFVKLFQVFSLVIEKLQLEEEVCGKKELHIF